MKALLQHRVSENSEASHYGDLSVFELGEIETPETPPTPTDVVIKVHAAAVNPMDLKRGVLPLDKEFPVVVGYDVAGTVHAVGSEVTKFKVGDKVYGDIMMNSIGPKASGSIAEYAVSPASILDKIPGGLSFVDASALPLVSLTAIQALRLAGTKEGDKVYVSAGAGGVGVHLLQIAKNYFNVAQVATTCSAAKVDFVKKYGADVVIDYKKENASEVLSGWADVVVDTIAEYDSARKIIKPGGKMVGINPPLPDDMAFCMLTPSEDDMAILSKLVQDGKLEAVIDSVFDLDDVVKALQLQESGRTKGKVVVKVV